MDAAPHYTRRFWAKAQPYRQPAPERIHLLEHHLADVGACLERLLMQPTIRRRLAYAGGRDGLDEATAARLAVFAALHDIGKVNIGFQTKVWTNSDHPARSWHPSPAGHTNQLLPVLNDDDSETADWFFESLRWYDDFLSWDDQDGATVCGLLVATLSHHGRPLYLGDPEMSKHPRLWQPYGELNPQEYTARIGKLLREWFPAAFDDPDGATVPPLPSAPAFQHHFLGLCNLADWIGSDEQWFPYVGEPDDGYIDRARRQAEAAIREVGLDIEEQRKVFGGADAANLEFVRLFAIDTPNAIQRAAAQGTPLEAPVVIIESETGSGKTEAALWRFARMYAAGLVDGMYFALPTRAAAVQIHGRVERFVANLFPSGNRPDVVLAVPGYDAAGGLPDYAAGYDSSHDGHYDRGRPWAAERPKKFLAAQIAVGTVDQAMLGALKVRNAHLRSSSLARNLLVVDEVHASDVYMAVVLQRLLAAHTGAGGYALLMSATLGSTARERWLRAVGVADADDADGDGGGTGDLPDIDDAIAAPYPAVSTASGIDAVGENGQTKEVSISAVADMRDFDAVARRALDAARAGAKVLVVRNTVGYAVSTQQRVEELVGGDAADKGLLFAVKGIPTLHHGRFAAGDRRLLDAEVEKLLGKGTPPAGVIVVGTQTLEQSLDIDADLLITDLCPVDVLLQRIGRLHRHPRRDRPAGYGTAQCIVLTPAGGDLAPLLEQSSNVNGLGPNGYVYRSLHTLEATRRLIEQHPVWQIPEMNRRLVERATHPKALDEISAELGADWKAHASETAGGYYADRQTALRHVIPFGNAFFPKRENRKLVFRDNEESIRTRLGDERVEITLDPPQDSPFGGDPIDKVVMPRHWLGKVVPEDPVTPQSTAEGFEFSIDSRRFRYDRRGLHQD